MGLQHGGLLAALHTPARGLRARGAFRSGSRRLPSLALERRPHRERHRDGLQPEIGLLNAALDAGFLQRVIDGFRRREMRRIHDRMREARRLTVADGALPGRTRRSRSCRRSRRDRRSPRPPDFYGSNRRRGSEDVGGIGAPGFERRGSPIGAIVDRRFLGSGLPGRYGREGEARVRTWRSPLTSLK